jgi:hypothetical protein
LTPPLTLPLVPAVQPDAGLSQAETAAPTAFKPLSPNWALTTLRMFAGLCGVILSL